MIRVARDGRACIAPVAEGTGFTRLDGKGMPEVFLLSTQCEMFLDERGTSRDRNLGDSKVERMTAEADTGRKLPEPFHSDQVGFLDRCRVERDAV